MEAPVPHNSSIKLSFGDNAHKGAPTPLHLAFTFDFFSQEEKQTRKKLEETLGIQLEGTAAVFELSLSGGNGKSLAERLNGSAITKEVNETSPSEVTYHAHDDKLYVVIKTFFEYEQLFADIQPEAAEGQQIHLNIASHNDLDRISQLMLARGPLGLLDSLELSFSFTKTASTEVIISKLLEGMGFPGAAQIVKSFKRLNFELNGASSSIFSEFPKIVFPPVIKKSKNDISDILAEANFSSAHFYLLNQALFLKGKLEVNGLAQFIAALHT